LLRPGCGQFAADDTVIHYNARRDGRDFAPKAPLPYALVVSVHAKHLGDLYDKVVRKYARQLEALRPVVEIPVTT
jgi:hypothetical protein